MPRYIEATEAIRVLSEYYHHRTDTQRYVLAEAISKVPTADVVEVVRCKDCKYYNSQNSYCEGIGNWFGLMNEWSDNGFCYKGERKETDDA